ncbi:MAG: hypothetical protein Q4F95_08230 [Oscillospiraceae bacterium]|nr:hypothetical protein [Oscillospiraceae bacterium]
MKKTILILLCASLLASCTACNDNNGSPAAQTTVTGYVNKETITSISDEKDIDEKEESDPGLVTSEVSCSQITIRQTVLADQDNIKITADGLIYDEDGAKVMLTLENNRDEDLSFYCGGTNSVNGYMIDDANMSLIVNAGESLQGSVCFDYRELAGFGITDIADFELQFEICSAVRTSCPTPLDTKQIDPIWPEPVNIKTSVYDSYDYSIDTYLEQLKTGHYSDYYFKSVDYLSEDEVYSKGDIRVISEALTTDEYGEKTVMLEVENNSDHMIDSSAQNIRINGLILTGSNGLNNFVCPGKRAVLYIPVSYAICDDAREPFGIKEIQKIDMTFTAAEAENDECIDNGPISIAFSETVLPFDSTGDQVYNSNGVRIISKGVIDDPICYYKFDLLLLVENNSTHTISFDNYSSSIFVNGYEATSDTSFIKTPPGASSAVAVSISKEQFKKDDFELESLSDIKNITLSTVITNEDMSSEEKCEISIDF